MGVPTCIAPFEVHERLARAQVPSSLLQCMPHPEHTPYRTTQTLSTQPGRCNSLTTIADVIKAYEAENLREFLARLDEKVFAADLLLDGHL